MIFKRFVACGIISSICLFYNANAQDQSSLEDDNPTQKNNEFSLVPYLNYTATQGLGYGLVPLYSFKIGSAADTSPASVIGALAYETEEGSTTLTTFGMLYLKDDKWRIQFLLGKSNYNFQTYYNPPVGDGLFIDYGTESSIAALNVRRRVRDGLYLGLGYVHEPLTTDFEADVEELETELNILQLEVFSDKRDSTTYPTTGHLFLARLNHMPTWLDNEVDSDVLIVNYNKYIPVKDHRDVVAMRFHTKAGLKNIRFQQEAVLGGVDLRGYSKGAFRGEGAIDVQAEYRWNFENKYYLSAVGFAGVGTIYGSKVDEDNWKAYPSIGAGIRYTALKDTHSNVGIDLAFGKDDWGVYFRINEAF